MLEVHDHYFHQAKKDGYVARSAYKLQEIDEKFHLFGGKVRTVIDIGCAPGSRLQYVSRKLLKGQSSKVAKDIEGISKKDSPLIIGFDLKKVEFNLPLVYTYQQDITDVEAVKKVMSYELGVMSGESTIRNPQCDIIISDMAPDTVGDKATDALRSIGLIYDTMWMYHEILKPDGKFAIKIFMGPGFEDFVRYCREQWGASHIKIFKPKACRKESKETYIIKI